jgi:P pilus assembly chaperone PapD
MQDHTIYICLIKNIPKDHPEQNRPISLQILTSDSIKTFFSDSTLLTANSLVGESNEVSRFYQKILTVKN